MTSEGKQRAKPLIKSIRVSGDNHARFQAYQHDGHFRSADVAMESLLAESVVRIPVPAAVMERWTEEAAKSGFPLDQWAAQRIETGTIKCAFHAKDVREAIEELGRIKAALNSSVAAERLAEEFHPCARCTTPNSCQIGGQDPEACE